jgi:dTDP-glucose 4,6-dehydratase
VARLLITGGAGFIGSNFVRYWLREHPEDLVVVLDALTYAGSLQSLDDVRGHAAFRFVRANICEVGTVSRLLREFRIDTVVHFAAESHVDRSILGPDAFIETNVVGTHALLKAARSVWLDERRVDRHRFHHISTDEVYGSLGWDDAGFVESTPYSPNSPYAASKAASDHLVRAYHHTYGLATTVTNCSNNYGPFHFPEKLIPLAIVNILEGRSIPIYGDGRNVRDWLYVEDHCRAIDLVLSSPTAGEVYNVGGKSECSNIDLVRLLCSIADEAFASRRDLRDRFASAPAASGVSAHSLIRFVKDRPGHDRRYAIDCTKLESSSGFLPRVALAEGLRKTFDWYVDNEGWWRPILDGSYRQWIATQYIERRSE